MRTVALIHTGSVVIEPISKTVKELLPEVEVINYLDDKIVAHLSNPTLAMGVPERVANLVQAARLAGADVAMLTCSSISAVAAYAQMRGGITVLQIDQAMADQAVSIGETVAVIATLPTTCVPTVNLVQQRAELQGLTPTISQEVVEGAFDAIAGGNKALHDSLVGEAIRRAAKDNDVVVLAQASMASAAEGISVNVPVLTSVESGVERLGQWLTTH